MRRPGFQRLLDLVVAGVLVVPALLVCLPLMLVICLESPGWPVLLQRRVGRHQRLFVMAKLRTMHRGTPGLPTHQLGPGAITRVGGVLRRSKLDELPQLLNVLAGQMSLVGPRPCLPMQTALIAERARLGLFGLRPGITGPAQLRGVDMSDPVRLAACEAAYFSRAGLADDLALLWRTLLGAGAGDAAVQR